MRILRVRFKNLSSLAGEWDIDLTHPAFVADGIFAITGPTGAGKTTILDAICLALYASTSRLGKVSKGANEIMSRQTGECFAEVTFETQSGRFRCHWGQHRARRKPDGELQQPKHEIVEADSGRIIDASVRGVAGRIETVTGMDFERFTRSMLLAQGAFDTFLRAAADERAPILEQITGTEVYSRISMGVHERQRDERRMLDALATELAGLSLLSDEDERQMRAVLSERQIADRDLAERLDRARQAIAWLDGLVSLDQELTLIAERWRDLGTREDAFIPERERLHRATRALELAGEHAGLAVRRADLARDRQARVELLTALPACEQRLEQAETALRLAGEALEEHQAAQARMLPILRQARELDLRLHERAAPILAATRALAEQEAARAALHARQTEQLDQLDANRQARAVLLVHLGETQADAALVEQLAGIRGRFDALRQLEAQGEAQATERRAAVAQIAASQLDWTSQSATLAGLRADRDSVDRQLDEQRSGLDGLLGQRGIEAWRAAQTAGEARKVLLEALAEAAGALLDARRSLEDLSGQGSALRGEGIRLAEQLQGASEQAAAREREQQLLETQLRLVHQIQNFEAARRQLADGEPCPLCGATEHPFAEGNLPLPDETTRALDQARAASQRAGEEIAALRVRQAETAKDLEQIAQRQLECAERIAARERQIAEHGTALALSDTDPRRLVAALPALLVETQSGLDQATDVLARAEAREHAISGLRDALEKARAAVALAELETQASVHRKEAAEQALARLDAASADLNARCLAARETALLEVAPHGVTALSAATLDPILLDLTARRDLWRVRQSEQSRYEQRIGLLESQTRQCAETIEQLDREGLQRREQLDAMQRERDALAGERQRLFADRQPDREETALAVAIETARRACDGALQVRAEAIQDLDRLKIRVAELAGSIETLTEQSEIAEAAFEARRVAAGFVDEQDYLAACLTEERRALLTRQAQQLTDERTALAARERDLRARIATERERRLSGQTRAELDEASEGLQREQKTLLQEIGGLRQRLTDNEGIRTRQRERLTVIAAQRVECDRWDRLHGLIGSSDGKKYRNFAQGLTFDIMIGHANRQLQRMSDRYLLIRDQVQPLELNVIDKDQAGEIRSAKNLSGGESFIVSLALALGLSQMASQNVRVDSLFLDEGFGTLDEDALETALETLAGLRRDGKLIGVISHVPALKERIGTQIQVTPVRGGKSQIQGPGCAGKG